jgi:hypothetical protein
MPFDQEQLRKTCTYESRSPVDAMAAELDEIERVAGQWRKARRSLLWLGFLFVLAGIAGLYIYPLAGLVLIALAIPFFVSMKRYPKGVAKGLFRCELTRAIISMLAHDTDPKHASSVRLAFDPVQEVISETVLPNRRKGKQKIYKACWLSLETTFLDGTSFTGTIEELVRQRSFVNPRGKSKTRTRTRQIVSMRFGYPNAVYGDVTPLASRMQKEFRLPSSASVRGVEVTGRAVKVKALVAEKTDLARTSTMLALGVYRILNLSRRLQRRARSKGCAQ